MKAALYARVSTQDQSCQMQLRELREYAAQRGLEIFDEYVDAGVSGSVKNRPQLDQMMSDAAKGRFKAVLVWRFDRFARSTAHLVEALALFKNKKIQFISLNENIDTSSPIGEAIFTIIGAMAQLERDIIRERVRGGLRNARAKGVRLGRRPSLDEARELHICRLHASGLSIRKIAEREKLSKDLVHRTVVKGKGQ